MEKNISPELESDVRKDLEKKGWMVNRLDKEIEPDCFIAYTDYNFFNNLEVNKNKHDKIGFSMDEHKKVQHFHVILVKYKLEDSTEDMMVTKGNSLISGDFCSKYFKVYVDGKTKEINYTEII